MYNPDDIEQALHEMKSQSKTDILEEELVQELYDARHGAEADFSAATSIINKERKTDVLGQYPDLIKQNDRLYIKTSSKIFIDDDGDRAEYAVFTLVTDDEIYELHRLANDRAYDRKDPLKYKLEKFLDWNDDAPVELPDGAELIHKFSNNLNELYQHNDDFYISDMYFNTRTIHRACVSETAKNDGIFSMAFAAPAAVKEDKHRAAVINAEKKLTAKVKVLIKQYKKVKISEANQ